MDAPVASRNAAAGTNAAPVVAVVGAGPAGVRAAIELAQAGLRPVLIDEAERIGGQIYRQGTAGMGRSMRQRYGTEATKAQRLFDDFEAMRSRIDHRPGTLAWHLEGRTLHLLANAPGARSERLACDALLLATGASERLLPFEGWTLPGVVTLGAAQIALKAHAALVGAEVVLAGSGPLLLLVAWQMRRAGARVVAVLDAAPPPPAAAIRDALRAQPGVVLKGARMRLALALGRVPVHRGARLVRAEGDGRIEQLHWRDAQGQPHTTACDALAFGHGLRSESQLADLAGCRFGWDAVDGAWQPLADSAGRSTVPGVYLAGDGAAIRGADAAEAAGRRAALALLADLGHAVDAPRARCLEASQRPWRALHDALERIAPPPADWAAHASDDVVVCRCEGITAGALRAAACTTGARELNRLKAMTRIGMGRCQGRMCGAAAARLLAQATAQPLADVGRLRSQPPVKPVPIVALAAAAASAAPVPHDQRDD